MRLKPTLRSTGSCMVFCLKPNIVFTISKCTIYGVHYCKGTNADSTWAGMRGTKTLNRFSVLTKLNAAGANDR